MSWLAVLITTVNSVILAANVHTRRRVTTAGDDAVNAAGDAIDTATAAAETVARQLDGAHEVLTEMRRLLADPYGKEDTVILPHLTPGQSYRADQARGRHRQS